MAVVVDAARVGRVRPEQVAVVGGQGDHLHRVMAVSVDGLGMRERLTREGVLGRSRAWNDVAHDRRGQEHPAVRNDGRGVAAALDLRLPEQVAIEVEVGRRAGTGTGDAAAVGAAEAGPVVGFVRVGGSRGRREACRGDESRRC